MNKDTFLDLLADDAADVKPLNIEKRVELSKHAQDEESLQARRQAATEVVQVQADPLAGDPIDMVDPMALLSFMRPGVQHGVYRNVRLGKYAIEARLDLHKMTMERARKVVYQFVKDCVANDVRMALITHGKGEGREQPALLKSCVAYWLPQLDEVLAFHTAQKQHGSYGATYMLLKKSDTKKLATREQHQNKR